MHRGKIVKWLFSIIPNKDNKFCFNDYFFKLSCERGNLEIVQWLCSLDSRYQIITGNDDEIIFWKILNKIKTIKTIKVEEKEECCICYEVSDIQTDCGHYGCQSCFNQLNNDKCPYCRSLVSEYYKIE